jgi:hypothetical protein
VLALALMLLFAAVVVLVAEVKRLDDSAIE